MKVNHDHTRSTITGVPEVILAEPKSPEDLIDSISAALEHNNKVLITRIGETQRVILKDYIQNNLLEYIFDDFERTLIVSKFAIEFKLKPSVAILSGGTSDREIVDEIVLSLKFLGWKADVYMDIGVAGIHRHQEALDRIHKENVIKCLIIVAGNEGALFSVVASQTYLPIIAVPAPIGYGFGGKGETALKAALQSCSPGISVVNIGNGFGAAAFVSKLLKISE